MAAMFKPDEKDVPQFQKDMCPKCILKGRCIEEGQDNHWFLTCPHYHRWKLGYPESFVAEILRYQAEHPEEAEADTKKRREIAKKLTAEKRAKKAAEKGEEKASEKKTKKK